MQNKEIRQVLGTNARSTAWWLDYFHGLNWWPILMTRPAQLYTTTCCHQDYHSHPEENCDLVIPEVFTNLLNLNLHNVHHEFAKSGICCTISTIGMSDLKPAQPTAQFCVIWHNKTTPDSDMQWSSGLHDYSIDSRSQRNLISVLGLHHNSHNCCGACIELSVS